MLSRLKPALAASIIAVFALQTSSCGYILHPERKGQTGGRIDPAIAVLDGVGLLLFLIPGIVAFAIDFHYGTIYLPGGKAAAAETGPDGESLKTVTIEGEFTPDRVQAIVARETGSEIDLETAEVRIARAASKDEIRSLLTAARPEGG